MVNVTPKAYILWFVNNYLHVLVLKTPYNILEKVEEGKLSKLKLIEVMISIEVNTSGKNTCLSR